MAVSVPQCRQGGMSRMTIPPAGQYNCHHCGDPFDPGDTVYLMPGCVPVCSTRCACLRHRKTINSACSGDSLSFGIEASLAHRRETFIGTLPQCIAECRKRAERSGDLLTITREQLIVGRVDAHRFMAEQPRYS